MPTSSLVAHSETSTPTLPQKPVPIKPPLSPGLNKPKPVSSQTVSVAQGLQVPISTSKFRKSSHGSSSSSILKINKSNINFTAEPRGEDQDSNRGSSGNRHASIIKIQTKDIKSIKRPPLAEEIKQSPAEEEDSPADRKSPHSAMIQHRKLELAQERETQA